MVSTSLWRKLATLLDEIPELRGSSLELSGLVIWRNPVCDLSSLSHRLANELNLFSRPPADLIPLVCMKRKERDKQAYHFEDWVCRKKALGSMCGKDCEMSG